jgi:hypothetical protein
MKRNRVAVFLGLAGALGTLSTGCVERQVVYVPTYTTPPPVYNPPPPSTPTYTYPNQTLYQPAPGQAPSPMATSSATANVLPLEPTPGTMIDTTTPPPPPQAETMPIAPGPQYVWTRGYWSWGGNTWVWVRGNWVIRPRVGVVWVPGRWTWRRHGYVWVGGYWR